jgi:hypothetical protein
VNFAAITLCVPSQRVVVIVYFVIESVRKLLDTPSYNVALSGRIIMNREICEILWSLSI